MQEMVNIPKEKLIHIEKRIKKLAMEKSYLELVINLINKLSIVPGLENTIEAILRLVVETIGGTNVSIYYFIDKDIYFADAYGKKMIIDNIDDPLVKKAFKTAEFIEVEHDYEDTKMSTPEFTKASTWAFPLSVGSEIIGILKTEGMLMAAMEARIELHTFLNYAALTLKNEILGYTQLQKAHDQLSEINTELINEIIEREKIEAALQKAKDELENRVLKRTEELRNANELLRVELEERKRTEMEKVKLKDQLQQAQKMEAIGTLAGGIAHDFNNILGIIMGYTELTLDDLTDQKTVIGNLQRVMSASERAKDMVQQILAFSRKSEQTMISLKIGKVINEVVTFLRSSIPSTVEIRLNIEENIGLIFANTTQINQVLMNLCTNAAHAMKKSGGVLEISLKEIKFDKDSSDEINLKPGKYQQLIVSDTGTGIREEIIDRIFDPYFTTKQIDEGTGMGLAVIYGIVKSYKGVIKVYSELGKGTVFNVYFPVLETGKGEEVNTDRKPDHIGNNEKVLLVDDERSLVELGTQILLNLGYSVEGRTSSVEALEIFKASPDNFDLIVTDMTMPDMTGVKLAAEIHKIKPDIPIILCTGFSTGINKNNFKLQGINALIMKPMIKSELAEAIHKVLYRKDQ